MTLHTLQMFVLCIIVIIMIILVQRGLLVITARCYCCYTSYCVHNFAIHFISFMCISCFTIVPGDDHVILLFVCNDVLTY